jgi:hypothetical protein
MLYFTTYFDINYLSRGLVLYNSLKETCPQFELYVLGLDEATLSYFQKKETQYPEIKVLSLAQIEEADGELLAIKSTRTKVEYYFTLSPCLPLFLLKRFALPHICSLDADILFYSNPVSLFAYLEKYSVVITPHKFSPEILALKEYGIFNVSFQIFKNDETGIRCLEKWREQCIDWCYDRIDPGTNRFADQKFLDDWPTLYPGKVKPLEDNISGLAPWNVNNFALTYNGNTFYSKGDRLIFFHFHGFKILATNWAANSLFIYKAIPNRNLDELYLHYWKKIEKQNFILGIGKDTTERGNFAKSLSVQLQYTIHVYFKLLNFRLLHIDYSKMPLIIKKIVAKIYG